VFDGFPTPQRSFFLSTFPDLCGRLQPQLSDTSGFSNYEKPYGGVPNFFLLWGERNNRNHVHDGIKKEMRFALYLPLNPRNFPPTNPYPPQCKTRVRRSQHKKSQIVSD